MAMRCLVLVTSALLAAATAPPALAETVHLRSGKAIEARSVEVLESTVVLVFERDGGSARIVLPFTAVDPRTLVGLLVARADSGDAGAQARIAWVAIESGLRDVAIDRAALAAALDPAFAPIRDAVTARVLTLEVADA